jgi:MtrB/PioB family decaheme-associated outer membrane protein
MATLRRLMVAALAGGVVMSAMSPVARAGDGEFTIGGQWFDQTVPEAKFQEFREVPRGGFLESFMAREWSGRNSVALWGANGIRSDQASRLTWANGARWRVDLGYAQIPHTFSQIARWGWLQSAPGVFSLPDSLQARNQAIPGSYTQRMADFLKTAPEVGLGFDTKVSTARLRARPARGWQFELRGTQRRRSGIKPYAMSFGFNTALENPEPIDERMTDADFIADFRRDRVSLQASAGLSVFQNRIDELKVDNPKRITDLAAGDGPAVGVLDLYPDNRVVRGSLALGYTLPRRTAINATLSMAETRQNDLFLGFTNNSALPQSSRDSLPAQSLDGKARQLNGDVRLTTRPVAGLDGTVNFRYTDYDNRTPELNFIGQTPYESGWQRFIEHPNHPLSNTRWQTGLDLNYAFTPQIRVGGIAEYRVRERTHREVEKDTEKLFGGRVRLRPVEGLSVAGLYTRGDRQADAFLTDEYIGLKVGATPNLYDTPGLVEHPALRRFDVADRVQDRATADVSYAFGERLDLSATYAFTRNDFKNDTTLGLQEDRMHSIASAATIHLNEKLDLTGGYGLGKGRTFQRSQTSAGAAFAFTPDSNWTAKIDEEEVFVFGGFEWAPHARLSVEANYQFSRNVTDYDLTGTTTVPAVDLPQTIFRRHETLLDASWHWLENTSIIGRWAWEDYDVNDFASNSVPLIFPVTGTANAIFLGDSSQGYRAHRLALLVKHTF